MLQPVSIGKMGHSLLIPIYFMLHQDVAITYLNTPFFIFLCLSINDQYVLENKLAIENRKFSFTLVTMNINARLITNLFMPYT
jgi:hypothetical protein